MVRILFFSFVFILLFSNIKGSTSGDLIHQGWNAFVVDSDIVSLKYFEQAYEEARENKDTENIATSLLYLAINTYGISYSQAMDYCMRSMDEFRKYEITDERKANDGRSRCLQLISTIYLRQGKFRESINTSADALPGINSDADTSGYTGLIYNSLGTAYGKLNISDSAEYFHRLALNERVKRNTLVYLPSSYINVGEIELQNGNDSLSLKYFNRALFIADSTNNRQAQVTSLIALGNWNSVFKKDIAQQEKYLDQALEIATTLNDKSFYIKCAENLVSLKINNNDFRNAFLLQQKIDSSKERINSYDRQKSEQSLGIKFKVNEKDRQLLLIQKEKDIAILTNYLLYIVIAFIIIILAGVFIIYHRKSKKDKLLIETKEQLVQSLEETKKLKETQMQNELEFKESQLSALAIQIFQKNELMNDLKLQLDSNDNLRTDDSIKRIINKGENHDREWTDFNIGFESLNKNFFAKLKTDYPEISPNDLKMCALIKLNLSIKEMAGILNISPDSVKTARYRLRKKFHLNTEDNLTDFIMGILSD